MATGSPTWRTLPTASTGCGGSFMVSPFLKSTCQPHGSPPTPASANSWPTNAATTPSAASAAEGSMPLIEACACGLRTIAA